MQKAMYLIVLFLTLQRLYEIFLVSEGIQVRDAQEQNHFCLVDLADRLLKHQNQYIEAALSQ